MSHPAAEVCLSTPYSAKPGQKGGTLIAEDVVSLEEHGRRLADPDLYRPERCGHCGAAGLHAHDFRSRVLRGDPEGAAERIRRYLCPICAATWQVLPAFLARHLHRRWAVVQAAAVRDGVVAASGSERRVQIPERTTRRWVGRLLASAVQLTQVLAVVGGDVVEVLGRVGTACTRAELIEGLAAAGVVAPGRKLEHLAGWVHRLMPGIRLM